MYLAFMSGIFVKRSTNLLVPVKYWTNVFGVHGSVHVDNIYVRLNVQLDVHVFICILYSSLLFALHVSGAICTHPQEYKLQRTAIGVCNGYGCKLQFVSQPVPAPMD
jgi:hypothetical protein